MANVAGGTIIWQLDIDDDQFKRKLVTASSEAKTVGTSISAAGRVGAANFASSMSNALDDVANGFKKVLVISTVVGTGISFGLYKATTAAFDQVRAVENASFALRAYEKDGAKVTKVLGELVAFARSDLGVLFQREDLFKAASNLRGFGEASDTLTDKVKILARGVSLGMITFDEFSQVVGRAAAKGRLDADQYDILAGRGIILDKSFRGAAISSESLFNELQRVLPVELLQGRANTIDGVFIRLQSAFRDLGSAILGVDKDTSQFIKGGLGDTFIQTLEQVRLLLKDPALVGGLRSIGQSIGEWVKEALPKAVGAFQWMVNNTDTIKAFFAAIVAGFLAAKLGAIAFSIAANANPIGLAVLAIAVSVTALVAAMTYLQVKFGTFTTIFEYLKSVFEQLKPVLDIIWQQFMILANEIGTNLLGIWRENREEIILLAKILGVALLVILGVLVVGILALVKVLSVAVGAIRQVLQAINWLQDSATNAGRATAQAFVNMYNTISGLVGLFFRVGADIASGIVNGIRSGAGAVIDTIKRIAADSLNTVKAFFGIRSPSKVMADIGKNLMYGMANGISSAAGSVVSTAQSASSDILGGFGGNATLAPNIAGEGFTGANTKKYIVNVTQNNSGIVARSRSDWREINKDGIESINEELRAKGLPELGGGMLSTGGSTV